MARFPRISPNEDEVQSYLGNAAASGALDAVDPESVNMAKSNYPVTRSRGISQVVQQIGINQIQQQQADQQGAVDAAMQRQQAIQDRLQAEQDKQQAAQAAKAAEAARMVAVRAAAAQGAVKQTDIQTGRQTIATRPDGSPVFKAGPIAPPAQIGVSGTTQAVQDPNTGAVRPVPNLSIMLAGDSGNQSALGGDGGAQSAQGTTANPLWAQPVRDDRGNVSLVAPETKTDPKTGEKVNTATDPTTGQPVKTVMGIDPVAAFNADRLARHDEETNALAMRENSAKMAHLAFSPKWNEVNDAFQKAQKAKEKLDEKGFFQTQFPDPNDPEGKKTVSMWTRIDPKTGLKIPLMPYEAARYNDDRANTEAVYAHAKANYDRLLPARENFTRNFSDIDAQKLRLSIERERIKAGLPEDDGGVSEALAKSAGTIVQTPAESVAGQVERAAQGASGAKTVQNAPSAPDPNDEQITEQTKSKQLDTANAANPPQSAKDGLRFDKFADPSLEFSAARPAPDTPQTQDAFKAISGLKGATLTPRYLNGDTTGQLLYTQIQRNGQWVASLQRDNDGSPSLSLRPEAHQDQDVNRIIARTGTDGVPVFLQDNPNRPRMAQEAAWAAQVQGAGTNPQATGPDGQKTPEFTAWAEANNATPRQLGEAVTNGMLSVQRGEAIMRNVWGGTLMQSDPTDPQTRLDWVRSKSVAMDKAAQVATGDPDARATGTPLQISQDQTDVIGHQKLAAQFMSDWYQENQGKPGVSLDMVQRMMADKRTNPGSMFGKPDKVAPGGLSSLITGQPEQKGVGNLVRGAQVALGQTIPLAEGVIGLFGDTLNRATGIGSGLRDWGYQGYQTGMAKTEPYGRENDDLATAWGKAKEGHIGAMVDFVSYGLGYTIGQAGEMMLTSAIAGTIGAAATAETGPGAAVGGGIAAVGGLVEGGAVKVAAKGLVERAIEKLATRAAAAEAEASAKKLGVEWSAEEIAKRAGSSALRKEAGRELASKFAVGANAFGMEYGTIAPEAYLKAKEEGRDMTAGDYAKVLATGFLAGGIDAFGDFVNLDLIHGKYNKALGKVTGSRLGKAAVAGGTDAVVQGSQEFVQTILERIGANQSLTDADAKSDILNSSALGFVGGVFMGGGAGAWSHKSKVRNPDMARNEQFATHYNAALSGIEGFKPISPEEAATVTQFVDPKPFDSNVRALRDMARTVVDPNTTDEAKQAALTASESNRVNIINQTGAAVAGAKEISAIADKAERDRLSGVVKVATGNLSQLTPDETAAVTGLKTKDGEPYFVRAEDYKGNAFDDLSDEARIEIAKQHPAVGRLITRDSTWNMVAERMLQQEQANGKSQQVGQPPVEENPPAGNQAAPVQPGPAAGGTAGANPTTTAREFSPVARLATMEPDMYQIHRDANPAAPTHAQVVSQAYAEGAPVHSGMAYRAGIKPPEGYARQHVDGQGPTFVRTVQPDAAAGSNSDQEPAPAPFKTTFKEAPLDRGSYKEHLPQAAKLAHEIEREIRAAHPRISLGVNHSPDVRPNGGVTATNERITLHVPDIAAKLGIGVSPAEAKTVITGYIVRHEATHVAQTGVIHDEWMASDSELPFEEFKHQFFLDIGREMRGKEGLYEQAKQIYDQKPMEFSGTSNFDHLEDWQQDAEVQRMLLEKIIDPKAENGLSELHDMATVGHSWTEYIRKVVAKLSEWADKLLADGASKEISDRAREYFKAAEAYYRELVAAETPSDATTALKNEQQTTNDNARETKGNANANANAEAEGRGQKGQVLNPESETVGGEQSPPTAEDSRWVGVMHNAAEEAKARLKLTKDQNDELIDLLHEVRPELAKIVGELGPEEGRAWMDTAISEWHADRFDAKQAEALAKQTEGKTAKQREYRQNHVAKVAKMASSAIANTKYIAAMDGARIELPSAVLSLIQSKVRRGEFVSPEEAEKLKRKVDGVPRQSEYPGGMANEIVREVIRRITAPNGDPAGRPVDDISRGLHEAFGHDVSTEELISNIAKELRAISGDKSNAEIDPNADNLTEDEMRQLEARMNPIAGAFQRIEQDRAEDAPGLVEKARALYDMSNRMTDPQRQVVATALAAESKRVEEMIPIHEFKAGGLLELPEMVRKMWSLIENNDPEQLRGLFVGIEPLYSPASVSRDNSRHAELEAKNDAGTITPQETQKARELVAAAAARAGYDTTPMYHGTGAEFHVFELNRGGQNFQQQEPWIFLSSSLETAKEYAANASRNTGGKPRVIQGFVRIKNPLVIEENSDGRGELSLIEDRHGLLEEVVDALQTGQFDGVIARDTGSTMATTGKPFSVAIAKSSSQVKSAEPFTGIPLARRFNPASDSILYSPASQPDLFAAIAAPENSPELAKVKVGTMSALGAYKTLTAKRDAGKKLSAVEEEQLLQAEQALGQKMAFDMDALKASQQPGQQVSGARPQPLGDPRRTVQQSLEMGPTTDRSGQMSLFSPTGQRPFYSHLERVVNDKIPNNASIEQIVSTIRGAGVKPEEIKWSGIIPKLQELAVNGKVPKAALQDYLRDEGAVRFEEVKSGRVKSDTFEQAQKLDDQIKTIRTKLDQLNQVKEGDRIATYKSGTHGRFQIWKGTIYRAEKDGEGRMVWKLDNDFGGSRSGNKISDKFLGELKAEASRRGIPFKKGVRHGDMASSPDAVEKAQELESLIRQRKAINKYDVIPTKYSQYQLPGGENYREVVLAMPPKPRDFSKNISIIQRQDPLNGNPWVANLIRRDGSIAEQLAIGLDRASVQAEAEREMTDTHGHGLWTNYVSNHFPNVPNYVAHMRTNDRTDAEGNPGLFIEELQSDRGQAGRKQGFQGDKLNPTDAEIRQYFQLREGANPTDYRDEMIDALAKKDDRIPDMPYRTEWPMAMFKRALRDAVAGGKKWVGWTTGETQNERYDLSKQVSEIRYWPDEDGTWGLSVIGMNGQTEEFRDDLMPTQKLEAHFGKDVARRMIDGEGDDIGNGAKSLSGDNLKVGGSGMKGFYDQIMPKEISKYVKQWGGVVERGGVLAGEETKAAALRGSDETVAEFERRTGEKGQRETPIWRVNITPAMERIAETGQPLFSPASNSGHGSFDDLFARSDAQRTPKQVHIANLDKAYMAAEPGSPQHENIGRQLAAMHGEKFVPYDKRNQSSFDFGSLAGFATKDQDGFDFSPTTPIGGKEGPIAPTGGKGGPIAPELQQPVTPEAKSEPVRSNTPPAPDQLADRGDGVMLTPEQLLEHNVFSYLFTHYDDPTIIRMVESDPDGAEEIAKLRSKRMITRGNRFAEGDVSYRNPETGETRRFQTGASAFEDEFAYNPHTLREIVRNWEDGQRTKDGMQSAAESAQPIEKPTVQPKDPPAVKESLPTAPEPAPTGAHAVAQRIVNAEEAFIDFAMRTAEITRKQAETALERYRKDKAIKIDPIGGQFSFTHGGFAEPETIRRAAGIEIAPEPGTPEFQSLAPEEKRAAYIATVERKKAEREAAAAGIQDFGEKIGGARKDTSTKTGETGRQPKANDNPGWFNRYEVNEVISDTKPSTPLESYWKRSASGGETTGDVGRFVINDKRKLDWSGKPERATRQTFATREEAEAQIPIIEVSRNHKVRGEQIEGTGSTQAERKEFADAEAIDRQHPGYRSYQLIQQADDLLRNGTITQAQHDEFVRNQSEGLQGFVPRPKPEIRKPEYRYGIWRDVTDRKRVPVVKETFSTEKEAADYMAKHASDIINTKTSWREELIQKPEKAVRSGPERRTSPATPEMFQKAFKFRGVEFGHWMRQAGDGKERQEVLNHAYDGLHDLAEVLGVPPAAMSLNGDLGLAFGARGQGLSGAKAHYEPDYVVINLTKMSGAGSLAHEWIHALDHYFGRQDGMAKGEWKTNKAGDRVLEAGGPENSMVSHGFSRNSNVREEVRAAFEKLKDTIFNKAVEYVEDSNKAENFVASSRKELESQIAKVRKEITAGPSEYWKRRKAATEAQLAVFDSLADRFVGGQDLETDWRMIPGGKAAMGTHRYTNDSLEKIGEIYKATVGRSGFQKEGTGPLDYLRSNAGHYRQRLQMLASATASETKTRKVPTDFSMNANRIDQGSATDYWNTPHEMLARAFSGYVEDRIAGFGGKSDFLSYGSDNNMPFYRWLNVKPFPEGPERAMIDKQFDHFFKTLDTRETDKGVALYSPAGQSNEPAPDQAIVDRFIQYLPEPQREVLEATRRGMDMEPVKARYGLSDTGVMNALKAANTKLNAIGLAITNGGMEPRSADGKIIGNYKLAGSAGPLAVIHQIQAENGIPTKVDFKVIKEQARRTVAEDLNGTLDRLAKIAQSGAAFNVQESADAMEILYRMGMSGKATSPEMAVKIAMLGVDYRDAGTEHARAMSIRRDPDMTPTDRFTRMTAESLFTDPDLKKSLEGATPAEKAAIINAWQKKVMATKAALKAKGLDLDATFAKWHADEEARRQAGEDNPRTKMTVDAVISKLSPSEQQVVKMMKQGAKLSSVAAATGLENETVLNIHRSFFKEAHAAMVAAAKKFTDTVLASPAGNMMDGILASLGFLNEADFNDTSPGYVAPENRPKSKPRQPAEPKHELAVLTPEQQAAVDSMWEKFKTAPPSRWVSFWQEAMDKLTPLLGQSKFTAWKDGVMKPWTDIHQTEMEGIANPAARQTFDQWISKPANQDKAARQEELFKHPVNETTGDWNEKRPYSGQGELIRQPVNKTKGVFDIHDPKQQKEVRDALNKNHKTSWADKIMEFWSQAILTGPQTAIVNTTSNLINAGFHLGPRRVVEAIVNDILKVGGLGSDQKATLGEFLPMSKVFWNAITSGARNAVKSWKLEERGIAEKMLTGKAIQDEFGGGVSHSGVGGESRPASNKGMLGKIMSSLSYRHMTAADEFIKSFAGIIERAAQAHRIAAVEEKLKGDAYKARMEKLLKQGSEAAYRAVEETEIVSFQEKMDGKNPQSLRRVDQVAQYIKTGKAMPYVGRVLTAFVPFVDTPTNIFKQAVELSPLGGLLAVVDGVRALRYQIYRGELTERQAQAKAAELYNRARMVKDVTNQIIGLSVIYGLMGLVGGGGGDPDDPDSLPWITGTTPYKSTKKGVRSNAFAVMPPMTIRTPWGQMGYGRFDPFATLATSLVDGINLAREKGGMSMEWMGAWLARFKDQADDKTFLQGISNLMNAWTDPDRFLEKASLGFITGFVPNLAKQVAREADPLLRNTTPPTTDPYLVKLGKALGYAVAPQSAPMKIDIWGNPIKSRRGEPLAGSEGADFIFRILDPSNTAIGPKPDPIDLYIFRWNLQTADPDQKINIEPIDDTLEVHTPGDKKPHKVQLSEKEQLEANVNVGKAARLMLGDGWDKRKPDLQTAQMITDMFTRLQRNERARLRAQKLGEIMGK